MKRLFLLVLVSQLVTINGAFCTQKDGDDWQKGKVIGAIKKLPKVLVFATGGTIAEKIDPKTGGAIPAVSGDDLIKAVPKLLKVASIKVIKFSNIDSSQMTPELWAKLAKRVDKELSTSGVKGAVITHGTDTMAEGAFFLELTLKTKKPVVFVGAMRNASQISPDGPANILNAVRQVAANPEPQWGVTVTMNQYINSAWRVRKVQTTNVQALNSGEYGYLGYIVDDKVVKMNSLQNYKKLMLPVPEVMPNVPLLTTFAGDRGDLVRFAVKNGAKGIVIEGVGAGNVNAQVFAAVKEAIKQGVVVVIASRVPNGGVYPLYADAGGGVELVKAGAILSGDLNGPKARIMLLLALSAYGNDVKKINGLFR